MAAEDTRKRAGRDVPPPHPRRRRAAAVAAVDPVGYLARAHERKHMHAHARHVMFALALLVTASGVALAGAPMAKGQAPGWYRMKLGDFEVTALSDGTADLPMDQLLTGTTPDKVKKALAAEFLTAPVETSVNAFLVNTGTKLVLIDTGAANLFGPTLGKLIVNLKASGYQPEQVDD